VAEVVSSGATPAPARPPYRNRFVVGMVVLGVLLAGAAAAGVVLGLRSAPGGDGSWSSWHPTKQGVDGAQQIADHLQPTYRLNEGRQLVFVRAGDAKVNGIPLYIVITDQSGNINLVPGQAMIYSLCGLGDRCSIREGQPSVQRSLLLRRESLELALYTFHYIGDIDSVVVLLPPKPGSDPSVAMLYRRDSLKPELRVPLHETLPGKPPRPRAIGAKAAFQINRLTTRSLFQYSVQQGQDGSAYLVLQAA
jgi:hypothetical protein